MGLGLGIGIDLGLGLGLGSLTLTLTKGGLARAVGTSNFGPRQVRLTLTLALTRT